MFDQITLPNGLRVVGEKLGHIHSCTVGVWVKVGSVNELPEENGLSHFIEHMVFKGTKNRTARQIAEEMDMVGGQLNAFTSKECTCFYAKVIDEDLKLAVDILSDLALRPTFDEKELNKERGVVLEEIAMVDDTPEDMVHELLAEAQFDGSLSMPILGPRQRIAAYSRDIEQMHRVPDVQVYYRGIDPTPIRDFVMTGMNCPVRLGDGRDAAICLPGDVVYGCSGGVLFIPPQLVVDVVDGGAKTQVKDLFGFEMISQNKFTTAQIDKKTWSEEMLDLLMEFIRTDERAAAYRDIDWSKEYDLARNGDPTDTQSAL